MPGTRLVEGLFQPVYRCPGCAAGGLRATGIGDRVIFRCPGCGSGWRVELGYAARVDPGRDRG
jgi:hypothetical protein